MKIVETLKIRFINNMHRHPGMSWQKIEKNILKNSYTLNILEKMEQTGGEPDVVFYSEQKDTYLFMDCSKESPLLRRSLCYDPTALLKRKKFPPLDSAINMANKMGASLLTEEEYFFLQSIETIDEKSSSWIYTPDEIRKQGGALFCDRKYNRVFTYYNGAESYYASRGFRVKIEV